MSEITLSYVLTTFNKAAYIKVVLPHLINNKKVGEEIIVIDGGSTDGTANYLNELKSSLKIDMLISERDKGEAHGFNKGFLLAKGDLIKVITDDDVYNYSIIQKCKDFMLDHPEVDLLGGNTGAVSLDNRNSLSWAQDFENDFIKWKKKELKNFFFNGTCLMIRRSSLVLTGLFNTAGILSDMEYTLRATTVANLAWCDGIISVRILNPQSNNLVFKQRADIESTKLCKYYDYKYPAERQKEVLANKSLYKKSRALAAKIKYSLFKEQVESSVLPPISFTNFEEAYFFCNDWLINHPKNKLFEFLTKEV